MQSRLRWCCLSYPRSCLVSRWGRGSSREGCSFYRSWWTWWFGTSELAFSQLCRRRGLGWCFWCTPRPRCLKVWPGLLRILSCICWQLRWWWGLRRWSSSPILGLGSWSRGPCRLLENEPLFWRSRQARFHLVCQAVKSRLFIKFDYRVLRGPFG